MRTLPEIFVATIVVLSTLTSAQTPVPVCCMGYTHVDETTLYIQGGFDANRTPVSQLIALDLTVPLWNTSAPPWSYPPSLRQSVPPTSIWHSMVASKDRRNLIIWDPLQPIMCIWSYSITEKFWGTSWAPLNYTQQPGVRLGADLTAGDIYMSAAVDGATKVLKVTPGISGVTLSPMPKDLMPVPLFHETFIWSVYRNSFLHYGGTSMDGKTANPHLNEFIPTTGWSAVKTTGPPPGDVSGHCMVPAYGGIKMIVFGGAGVDGIAKADIHILDLPTSTWTIGKPAEANQARTNMACVVAGDSFIAWGGESGQVNKDAVPIVYDIRNNQWTTEFRRNTGPGATEPTELGIPPRPSTLPVSVASTTNIAAIGGGVAGAVMVVAFIGSFVYWRRTRRQGMHDKMNTDTIIGLSARDPQNPGGDPKAELLEACYPLSPPPTYFRLMYFDQDELFRHLTASPLAGPHSFMKDPQGQTQQDQQFQPMGGDRDGFEWPSNGFLRSSHLPSSPTSPRSPQAVHRTSIAQRDRPSNGSDDNNERNGQKSAQPSPSSPRSPQVTAIDGQNGFPKAPQWQSSIQPVVVSDQRWDVVRGQEHVRKIDAIRAEQIELEESAVTQDVVAAQMQAALQDPLQSTLHSNKK